MVDKLYLHFKLHFDLHLTLHFALQAIDRIFASAKDTNTIKSIQSGFSPYTVSGNQVAICGNIITSESASVITSTNGMIDT